MKKCSIVFILIFLIITNTQAQEIIENPERPLNSKAGRVLKVEEILRITDESGGFYFSYPNTIKIAYDDSIFIKDSQQLLRFDQKGRFIRNYFVKGQGPGELTSVNNYVLTEDAIIIYDGRPRRITWFNYDGELIKDFKIDLEVPSVDFLLFSNNTYYFFSRDHIITNEKPLVVDQPHRLFALTQNGKEISELIEFPVKMYMLSSQNRAVWMPISRFYSIDFKKEYLMVSHTQDYLIKIFDFGTQSVIRRFNREYKRVETPPEIKERNVIFGNDRKKYPVPEMDFLNDVRNLFIFDDKLWVQTSTKDKMGRYLYDVFDILGSYVDSFYLDVNGTVLSTHGDYIYVREKDEDELFSIVKYKLIE